MFVINKNIPPDGTVPETNGPDDYPFNEHSPVVYTVFYQ